MTSRFAECEGHAHAGQVVVLGQRVELNADLLRARNGQEGQTLFPVQHNVGIRVVVQNDDVVPTRPEGPAFCRTLRSATAVVGLFG